MKPMNLKLNSGIKKNGFENLKILITHILWQIDFYLVNIYWVNEISNLTNTKIK